MKPEAFRWNEWNLDHVTRHGVSPAEAEAVVRGAGRGWPQKQGAVPRPKWVVQGRGQGDRMVQVVYVLDGDQRTAFIIHAMPLTTRRRRRRRR